MIIEKRKTASGNRKNRTAIVIAMLFFMISMLASCGGVQNDSVDEAYLLEYTSAMNYEPFAMMATRIFNGHAGVGWTSTAHTGVPVAVYAKGSGAELFDGSIDNTDICRGILPLCGREE